MTTASEQAEEEFTMHRAGRIFTITLLWFGSFLVLGHLLPIGLWSMYWTLPVTVYLVKQWRSDRKLSKQLREWLASR